ncbi:MAG: aminomethyl transferase family protein [Myxococcales bacterium]|nr:aminomethyl transferase family protein [Myxococcales bacterium]
MAKYTPFHPRTGPLMAESQAWRRWAGNFVASAYDVSHDREYAALRNAAGLIDVSPLWKYRIEGPDAARLLDRVVTRDVRKCQVGQVLYTPWCDSAGKVIDDGTVSRLGESTFRMTAADPSLRWLTLNAVGMNVTIDDVSLETAALALQGPRARDILGEATSGAVTDLKYFRVVDATLGGVRVQVSRTGYTGDLGYELWIPEGGAVAVWDALTDAGANYGLTPAGIWALDVARIEAGLIMLDVDYVSSHRAISPSQLSSPFELSLGWAVSAGKGEFVGQRALEAERAKGSPWQLVGIDVDWVSLEALYLEAGVPPRLPSVAFRSSVPLYGPEGRQVGYASSGCWSPLLKKFIALAHVEAAFAKAGTSLMIEVTVEHQRKKAKAVVAALPFFNPERKRS